MIKCERYHQRKNCFRFLLYSQFFFTIIINDEKNRAQIISLHFKLINKQQHIGQMVSVMDVKY